MKLILKGADMVFQSVITKIKHYIEYTPTVEGASLIKFKNLSFEQKSLSTLMCAFLDGRVGYSTPSREALATSFKNAIAAGAQKFYLSGKVTIPSYIKDLKYTDTSGNEIYSFKSFYINAIYYTDATKQKTESKIIRSRQRGGFETDASGNLVYDFTNDIKEFEISNPDLLKEIQIRANICWNNRITDSKPTITESQYFAKIENFNIYYETESGSSNS